MKLKVIPFEVSHLDFFEQRPEDIERHGKLDSKSQMPLAEYGTSLTVIHDGRILIIGGILQTTLHTGKCWAMVSVYANEHGRELLRQVKGQLERMMVSMGIHRVETANIKEAESNTKWCKLLGFVEEGEMKYYDDKKRTYILLAKFMMPED